MKSVSARIPQAAIVGFFCVLIPLVYILYTGQIWEDFLITFRFSENLVHGKGLVYFPGERIYGFTSPLETLILAFCSFITGKSSYLAAVWVYRIICMAVFAGAGVMLFKIASSPSGRLRFAAHSPSAPRNDNPVGRASLWGIALVLLFLSEVKTVAFSVNGMETAYMLFFLSAFIYLYFLGFFKYYLYMAVCWAGLVWTRPDGCVYIFALALAILIFGGHPKKKTFITLLKMSLIAFLLYLPWLAWSWYYYGSPIPHTVIAKAHYALFTMKKLDLETRFAFLFESIFGPFCYRSDTTSWPDWIRLFTRLIGFFVFIYWLFPFRNRQARTLSFAYFMLCLYYLCVMHFSWYFPPVALLGFIVIVMALSDFARAGKYRRIISAGVFFILVCGFVSIFVMSARQMRIQQQDVEMGVRKQVGLWLGKHVLPGETVYCEPLGYIGYFSNVKILDYPGLVSHEVVSLARKDPNADFYTIFDRLAPDWVVLRLYAAQKLAADSKIFRAQYREAKEFNAAPGLVEKYDGMPGLELLLTDAQFIIYKKRGAAG